MQILAARDASRRYVVAYSGGMDSHVLLHTLAGQRGPTGDGELRAVYIDHGLQRDAARWAKHCAAVCVALDVSFRAVSVDARPRVDESPEAAARRARYAALAEILAPGECLLTAHHQDDQAETLLLQLLRGAGPHGLAAMPTAALFGSGAHVRPLLDFSRAQLVEYAREHDLRWIEDPSNFQVHYDRNHLRHQVWPSMTARWPAAARTLTRAAAHQAEAAQLLDDLAAEDYVRIATDDGATLSLSEWRELSAPRQRNVMRYWIKRRDLPLPDTTRLLEAQHELLQAGPDRMPCITWPGAELRRYRDYIYALRPVPAVDTNSVWQWEMRAPLTLAAGTRLRAVLSEGVGVRAAACRGKTLTVRYRQGGEQCRPTPRGVTRTLKHLLQDCAVPPWERERQPLIYIDDALAAMVGVCVCAPFHAQAGEVGVTFMLERGHD